MADSDRLGRDFFSRNVVVVARELVDCELWTAREGGVTAGVVVETEAYADETDLASHASRLKSGRVLTMWGEPGIAYVYRSYGIHTMLNFVCQPEGSPSAVLIRALRPIAGIDVMRRRRGIDDDERLCKGPGSLTIAMGIRLDDHGVDVVSSDWIWLTPARGSLKPVAGERIGISRGKERPWRFFLSNSKYVSAHRRATAPEPTQ